MNKNEVINNMVWSILELIEDKQGKMGHEIPELKTDLYKFQDGKLRGIVFYNRLTKYWDTINV